MKLKVGSSLLSYSAGFLLSLMLGLEDKEDYSSETSDCQL
jgi:hypothetical protein